MGAASYAQGLRPNEPRDVTWVSSPVADGTSRDEFSRDASQYDKWPTAVDGPDSGYYGGSARPPRS
ncbi:hypothetical protein C0Q70_00648 [Pomacea canaliculata]|uniref:Uncharacterized protein n=1 Tax=Pomacea canaliculata TaxID=400727 RepID=A0A2T7PXA8_POMCA|nr:hypothetical protein C0Q70_00648 [Pomacea canaliculata]